MFLHFCRKLLLIDLNQAYSIAQKSALSKTFFTILATDFELA